MNIGYENSGHLYLETNSFKKLIEKYFKTINIDNTDNCDIIIKSPLSGSTWNNKKKKYIYWSGESRYVQLSEFHTKYLQILSFISNESNSIYIPFCLESRHIYKNRINTNLNREFLIGYCCSNNVEIREQIFSKFVEKVGIKNCASFGTCCGNYEETKKVCGGDYQGDSLIHCYGKCKFILALENTQIDGYVTEKIINAFYSGSIPIYWGSNNINDLFNKEAFINVDNFENIDKCIDHIINMTDEQREFMLNQPIYKEEDLINILNDEYNNKNNNKILEKYEEKIKIFFADTQDF